MCRASHARFAGAALLLGALAVLPFAQTARFGFIYFDDNDYVTANHVVRQGLSWSGLRWAFEPGGHAANWHPLTWISHMADVSLFGPSPDAMHAVNVLLHAAAAIVLMAVLLRLTGQLGPSLAAAALWAVHPLRVESVAWISERKDVLSGFLGLLAVLCYLVALAPRRMPPGGATAPSAPPTHDDHPGWNLLATTLFALAFMAKPTVVTFPLLAAMLEYTLRGRVRWRNIELSFWVAVCGMAITIHAQGFGGAIRSAAEVPWLARVLNAVASIGVYVGQTLLPVRLAVLYPWKWPTAAAVVQGAAAFILLGVVLVYAVRSRSSEPAPSPAMGRFACSSLLPYGLGIAWFVVALGPMLGLLQVGEQSHADRYTYWPSIGLAMAAAWGLTQIRALRPRAFRPAMLVSVFVVAALLAASIRQSACWRNTETLFRHTAQVTARNYVACGSLGLYLCIQGRANEAIPYLRQAAEYHHDPFDLSNLAWGLIHAGRLEDAERVLAQVGEMTHNGRHVFHSGLIAARRGRYDDAETMLVTFLQNMPENAIGWWEFGDLFARQKKWPQAVAAWRRALDLDLMLQSAVLPLLDRYAPLVNGAPVVDWPSLLGGAE